MNKTTRLSVLVVLILSAGCGVRSTPDAAPSTPGTAPSTPDSAIQELKIAAKNRDALAFASMISPETVAYMIEQQMPYCFEGYLLEIHPDQVPEHKKTSGPDNDRNIKVYHAAREAGIDESTLDEITQPAHGRPLRELYLKSAQSITSKVKFLARSVELSNELQKAIGADRDAFTLWNEGVFGAIDENGDKATAKVSLNGRDTEIHFQRIENRWRFYVPENAR